MNSQDVSQVFRTGDRTRTPSGSSTGRVLLACAGLALFAPLALAGGGSGHGGNWGGGGGTRWGVSVGVSSGGSYVGGSYSSGFYGGGRGYCAPAPYCAPVRPYWGPGFYGRPYWYGGYRPFYAPYYAPCAPVYLPPVVVAPNTYLVDRPTVSVGLGVAGSNGAGFVSYTAPLTQTYSSQTYSLPTYAEQISQPVAYSAPSSVVTFVNPNPTTAVQTAGQQSHGFQPEAPAAQEQAHPTSTTVFHASGTNGVLDRGQTPTSIVNVLHSETGDARANTAESFLGKTPAQAWPVTFEGMQETNGMKEIRCRTIDSLSSGYKPTIIVRGAGESNMPPRQGRGFVTGRIASITVDDPAYPGGLIVIDDAWLKW
ncbi:MAG: hypothetical protein ACREJD_02365 [Phycisphaerales bacterium]